ncbi:hypothetical protein GQR58_024092 [Nymphon striatum]|nr:hypothetical protein GQR58_024092 [Nymphon striatum]
MIGFRGDITENANVEITIYNRKTTSLQFRYQNDMDINRKFGNFSTPSSIVPSSSYQSTVNAALVCVSVYAWGTCTRTIQDYIDNGKKVTVASQSHLMSNLGFLSVVFCIGSVILFFVVFFILNFCTVKFKDHDYEPLSQRLDTGIDKVALINEDFEEDDE